MAFMKKITLITALVSSASCAVAGSTLITKTDVTIADALKANWGVVASIPPAYLLLSSPEQNRHLICLISINGNAMEVLGHSSWGGEARSEMKVAELSSNCGEIVREQDYGPDFIPLKSQFELMMEGMADQPHRSINEILGIGDWENQTSE